MTLKETLIICMLNTITDKQLMVKVNKNIVEGMDWTEVRNVIIKLDRAAHLSDVYHQTNRMHASVAQSKSCRACEKKGHMSASCNVPKTKLSCSHCNLKGSHNTNACLKKQKATKKKEGSTDKKGKEDSKKDPPSTKRDSETNFHNVCVQLKLREEIDSKDTDSEEESYNTPPESNQENEEMDS